jgi:hypothetical protein
VSTLHTVGCVAALAVAGSIGLGPLPAHAIVGVLEDSPGHHAGDPHYRAVRVVFRRDESRWVAFPNDCRDTSCLQAVTAQFPPRVDWTIAFDGKALGRIESRAPTSFDFYSSVGQQEILGQVPPPSVGQRSASFGGFSGEAVYRPLIVVSPANYRDPEHWKPTALETGTTDAIRKAFRDRFPRVTNCTARDVEHAQPYTYLDSNVIVRKAYSSTRRFRIAEVMLAGYRCDGPPDEAFTSQWFVITPLQQVHFLDSGMWLVDAGDYDNDGRSELVFAIDGENHGGYRLYSDDLTRKAIFEFAHH